MHIEADLRETIEWAKSANRRWAFTTSNAGAVYADFYRQKERLSDVDWGAVRSNDSRSANVKEKKQAEFLVRDAFPWSLVERIGVHSSSVLEAARKATLSSSHRPSVEIQRAGITEGWMQVITYHGGNILDSTAEALVNTVNCVGVMGRGVALQFKEAYPDNAQYYVNACERGEVKPGQVLVFDSGRLIFPRYIFNFPTKRHWRADSRIEDIRTGLDSLVNEVRMRDIHSIAIPPLGSGLGRLDWNQVRPLIEEAAGQLSSVNVEIYLPRAMESDYPDAATKSDVAPRMTAARAALIMLMDQCLRALMDVTITVLEVHKLAYFLQTSGEPLRIRFVKAPHGPFGENLHYVLGAMSRHFVDVDAPALNAPETVVRILPGAIEDAREYMNGDIDTAERVNRVMRLVEGFETPFGLELLASVHWLIKQGGAQGLDGTLNSLYSWAPGKRQSSIPQIELAINRLSSQSWV